jgi:hypothetical protein
MSSDEEEMNYESGPRQDGLNIASQFHLHAPAVNAKPSEEKKSLLQDWGKKTDQIRKLVSHFECELSQALLKESSSLIEELASFFEDHVEILNEGKDFEHIPTALVQLGWRTSDKDALFDFMEEKLEQIPNSCLVRLEVGHTTDAEAMKRQIVSSIICHDSLPKNLAMHQMKKGQGKNLPYLTLAEQYYAAFKESRNPPIVIIIEDIARANAQGLAFLFPLLKTSLRKMPVILILGCCSHSVSLNHLVPSKAVDCLAVRSISSKSPKDTLDCILSDVLVSKPLFSFKFGPTALKLLQDNFLFYNISLEKMLSIVKLMIMNHFRGNDASILSAATANEVDNILKCMSETDLSALRDLVRTLPSMSGMDIPESDTHFKSLLGKHLRKLHHCHSEFLACVAYLDMLSSDVNEVSRGVSLACCLIQMLQVNGDITEDREFKDSVKFVLSLSLDDLKMTLEFCVNNNPLEDMHAGGDNVSIAKQMSQLISKKLQELKYLEIELNDESQTSGMTSSKKRSLTDSSNVNKTTQNNNSELLNSSQRNKSINLSGLKSRQEWKERLKEQIVSSSSSSKAVTSASKFEQFKQNFVSELKSIFQELRSPLNLPLSEVVYFDDAASIAGNYYPNIRHDILNSLREPIPDQQLTISEVYQTLAGVPASIPLQTLYGGFSSSSFRPNGTMKKSSKAVSPKKRSRKSKSRRESDVESEEEKDREEVDKQEFFTLINDMEYIGLIQRSDKKKSGHITKLVWE